jgi:hypothetical protein
MRALPAVSGEISAARRADRKAFAWPSSALEDHMPPPRNDDRAQEVATMPQKEHLPRVSDKEQRMYEHIKKSELEQGRSKDRAKAIAAATVVKHHNESDHSSGR